MRHSVLRVLFVIASIGGPVTAAFAAAANDQASRAAAPPKVEVRPVVKDEQIRDRLDKILAATGWFKEVKVDVDEGVVFLQGRTSTKEHHAWAGDLAKQTEDVVAVVNQIQVERPPAFDVKPAIEQVEELLKSAVRASPIAVLALVVLLLSWFATKLTVRLSASFLERRLRNGLLVEVGSRTLAIPVFVCGLYLVLQISGLTGVAVTVAGGTGLAGLIVGIAFHDILENFLASILISVQHPFLVGDLIQVDNKMGFVQRVTTRGTVLMAYDGTYIQIPNSTMYKSTIHNFTANPKMRQEFVVAIGLTDPVDMAQNAAVKVLREHPAILQEPEPMVLVDEITGGGVNLRVYFWVDARQYSDLKVRSSAIRLVKTALQDAHMLSPDGIQRMVIPQAISVQVSERGNGSARGDAAPTAAVPKRTSPGSTAIATTAEGDLGSDLADLQEQAAAAPLPETGTDLLSATHDSVTP